MDTTSRNLITSRTFLDADNEKSLQPQDLLLYTKKLKLIDQEQQVE
jgi:hypothetical protein